MFGDKIPSSILEDPKKLDLIFKIIKFMFRIY